MSKAHRNNTDINKTDYSDTDILSYPDRMRKDISEFALISLFIVREATNNPYASKLHHTLPNGFLKDEKIHPRTGEMHDPMMSQTVNRSQFLVKEYSLLRIGSLESKN